MESFEEKEKEEEEEEQEEQTTELRRSEQQLPIIFEHYASLRFAKTLLPLVATRPCSTSSDLSSCNIAFETARGHVRFTELSHNDSLVSPCSHRGLPTESTTSYVDFEWP